MKDSMRKARVRTILTMLVLYIIQFIICPALFGNWYPQGNETAVIFLITTIPTAILLPFISKFKPWICVLANFIYCILIILYHAKGAYGIGLVGLSFDDQVMSEDAVAVIVDTSIIFVALAVIECDIFLVRHFLSKIKVKNRHD